MDSIDLKELARTVNNTEATTATSSVPRIDEAFVAAYRSDLNG